MISPVRSRSPASGKVNHLLPWFSASFRGPERRLLEVGTARPGSLPQISACHAFSQDSNPQPNPQSHALRDLHSGIVPTEVRLRASGICNTFGRGATILTPFLAVALFRSYGIRGVLSLMTGFLLMRIAVVLRFGIEPKKRRLEDME